MDFLHIVSRAAVGK